MSGESYCPECSAVMSGLPHNCTQGSIGLTDEEILELIPDFPSWEPSCARELLSVRGAQLKKFVEWRNQECTEHRHTINISGIDHKMMVMHNDCERCWQSLLDEVKE